LIDEFVTEYFPGMSNYVGDLETKLIKEEWSFKQVGYYTSKAFDVLVHSVTNLQQATKIMICKKRLI
jgi:hypothetical protein